LSVSIQPHTSFVPMKQTTLYICLSILNCKSYTNKQTLPIPIL
jgi:hypothetical protein